MTKVANISFKEKGKTYLFDINELQVKNNLTVIVETERGLQFGTIVGDVEELNSDKIKTPLKKIIRIATKKDYDQNKKNNQDAKAALEKCRQLVEEQKLNMQIIDASYTFDKDQLVFRFLADNRVDFRTLAKELASIYRTRIELRQIGVRDKAKEIGGIGPCGRTFCCSKFLKEFESVSINMAKHQGIALNPSKINGVCGRLLCCLKYEDECYKECGKCVPNVGKKVSTPKGEGRVVSVDILKKKYVVNVPGVGNVEMTGGSCGQS